MHRILSIVILTTMTTAGCASVPKTIARIPVGETAQTGQQKMVTAQTGSAGPWRLVWHDEFDGCSLDRSRWSYRALGKRGRAVVTQEAVAPDCNGHLGITVSRSATDGTVYTGMISSQYAFQQKFGYFEARFRSPKTIGFWPAFWLQSTSMGDPLGDPFAAGAEIDIIEYLRIDGDRSHHAIHWDGYGEHLKSRMKTKRVRGLSEGWHTYGLEWTPDYYAFYVDGRRKWKTRKAISGHPEYIILSVEVKNWAGDIDEAELPETVLFDYVRVYQHDAFADRATTPPAASP